jgi:hypothetical protein
MAVESVSERVGDGLLTCRGRVAEYVVLFLITTLTVCTAKQE